MRAWWMVLLLSAGCTATSDKRGDVDDTDTSDTDTQDSDTDTTTTTETDTDTDTDTITFDPEDPDRDGFTAAQGDCGPDDPDTYPGARDRVGDGNDQNCDGVDGVDADGDGSASELSGGDDCNDASTAIHGLDSDADGVSICGGDCDDDDNAVGVLGSGASCARLDAIHAVTANVAAGEAVFTSTCVACHDRDGVTERVGPGLSGVVPDYDATALETAIFGGVEDMDALPLLTDQQIADVSAWVFATWGT